MTISRFFVEARIFCVPFTDVPYEAAKEVESPIS